MMGPDYTHWHGLYDVAKVFYTEFIPEAQELVAKAQAAGGDEAKAAADVAALIESTLGSDDHKWFIGKMTPEEKARRAQQRAEFATRYATRP
jgi:hydroxylamine dehydrogenase